MESTTKICTCCKQEKELSQFYTKNKNKKLSSQCKQCENKKRKLSKEKSNKTLTEEQKNKIRERRRFLYNLPNSKYKERVKAEKKKYYEKLALNNETGKYYQKNKENLKAYAREYKKTDNGRCSAINYRHKRRALLKNGDVTTEQLKNLYSTCKNCYWCGIKLVKENTHLDHLMPFKLGGKHTISNLVLACSTCNIKKQGKDPLEFAKTLDKSYN